MTHTFGRVSPWRSCLFACVLATPGSGYTPFTNYKSAIRVNDITSRDGVIYAATSGGLLCVDPELGTRQLKSDAEQFPDPDLTALCLDSSRALWIGSRRGYLYRIARDGCHDTYKPYYTSGWSITELQALDRDHLVVGSTEGLSLFAQERGQSLQRTRSFGDLVGTGVNVITIYRGRLYVGLDEGTASLDISEMSLNEYNLYDQSIWAVTREDESVRSFVPDGSTVQPSNNVGCANCSGRTFAQGRSVYRDGEHLFDRGSEVLAVYQDADGKLWCGTSEHYLSSWDGEGVPRDVWLNRLSFEGISRVHLATDGKVWLLPLLAWPLPWHKRVMAYKDGTWWRYDDLTDLGNGRQAHFQGICEGADGAVWLSTWGEHVKYYDNRQDAWLKIRVGNGASLAVARDSSGFLWVANNYDGSGGASVNCVNPTNPREGIVEVTPFYDDHSDNYIPDINSIHVDLNNTILMGGREGKLVSFRHDGHPDRGEQSVIESHRSKQLGMVHNMTHSPDTSTWIAASAGVYRCAGDASSLQFIEGIDGEPKSVVLQSKSVAWIGTTRGLVRFEIDEYYSNWGSISDLGDTLRGKTRVYGTNEGMVHDEVTDLAIDLERGVLWVGTETGLSSLDLTSLSEGTESAGRTALVYPNPFSFKLHDRIVFEGVGPGERLHIYSSKGNLVAEVLPDPGFGSVFEWKPGDGVMPGSYFYSVPAAGDRGIGKLLLIP